MRSVAALLAGVVVLGGCGGGTFGEPPEEEGPAPTRAVSIAPRPAPTGSGRPAP